MPCVSIYLSPLAVIIRGIWDEVWADWPLLSPSASASSVREASQPTAQLCSGSSCPSYEAQCFPLLGHLCADFWRLSTLDSPCWGLGGRPPILSKWRLVVSWPNQRRSYRPLCLCHVPSLSCRHLAFLGASPRIRRDTCNGCSSDRCRLCLDSIDQASVLTMPF